MNIRLAYTGSELGKAKKIYQRLINICLIKANKDDA